MTPEGQQILKELEGLRLKPYDDHDGLEFTQGDLLTGKLTIGWGRNLNDRGITKEEAQYLFDNDLDYVEAAARKAFPWFASLDPVRQDVIVNLCFNIGIGGVQGFKRMIAAIERHDWPQAAWELSNSQWKSQVGRERHDMLTEALEYGKWPS